jgi:hypothetical protein
VLPGKATSASTSRGMSAPTKSDLALVSQILGHADRLADEIMYLLVQGLVVAESGRGGFLVYNRYDSGTEGLRFFKDRCGFERTAVEWSQW